MTVLLLLTLAGTADPTKTSDTAAGDCFYGRIVAIEDSRTVKVDDGRGVFPIRLANLAPSSGSAAIVTRERLRRLVKGRLVKVVVIQADDAGMVADLLYNGRSLSAALIRLQLATPLVADQRATSRSLP